MLTPLFNPKSVALVGASSSPGKLGFDILSNLVKSEYKGEIYPVNPHSDMILGKRAYKDVTKIPKTVDLALIAVPAPFVLDVLKQCVKKKIKNVVIISAGFKEIGEEGGKREDEIQKLVQKNDIRIVGPNCLGIINAHLDFNGSFAENNLRKGNIALVSQSGALAVAITDWAGKEDIGFSKIISLGNKVDVNENDCIEYLTKDSDTDVIMLYLESFAEGRRFMDLASKISLSKPIILFKAGVSEAGTKAVASHTGSLAGSNTAIDTALKQSGVIRAYTIEDFFDFARMFSMQPLPKGNKVAVLTNAGGPGVISTDAVDEAKTLTMAEFSKKTAKALRSSLPKTANTHNPVDVVGDALADRYEKAMAAILADDNVNILFTLLTPQVMTEKEKTVKILINFNKKYPKKTFLTSFIGGENVEYAISKLRGQRIPNFLYPNRAVRCLEKMIFLKTWREKQTKKSKKQVKITCVKEILHRRIKQSFQKKGEQLPWKITSDLLRCYKIHIPKLCVAKSEKEAVQFAKEIGFPVVLKIISDEVLHKTDVGGVRLGLNNEDEIKKGYMEIVKNVKKHVPKAKINGIMVQQMQYFGREVIIGMKRDSVFGPLIMFGLGGVYVEVMKDVSFRVTPFSYEEAIDMIYEVKAIQLLKGVRGEAPADIEKIAETILQVSNLAVDFPEIKELDINPLLVMGKGKGVTALDVRFIL